MRKFLYFAYASNLLENRIKLNQLSAIRKGVGKLIDYRLDFMHYSDRWKGAAATIVPTPASIVWGAIWELDDADLASLDKIEMYANLYFRYQINVETNDNKSVLCHTYQQINPPELLKENEVLPYNRRPSDIYKNCIIAGAIETGLPEDYINYLKKIPSIPVYDKINVSELFQT